MLVARGEKLEIDAKELEDLLKEALKTDSLKDAVAKVVAQTGLPRRQVYQAALTINT